MSRNDQPVETEIKLRIAPESRADLEQHPIFHSPQASGREQRRLVTTYFDTPALTLSRQGLSLRVRHSDRGYVQTVKSVGTGHGVASRRGEWEWPISGNTPEPARLAQTPIGAALGPADLAALEPVFTTEVCRTSHDIRLDDGTLAEVALDDGWIVAGNASEPISEVEIELKAGQTGSLYRLALELSTAAPLAIEPASKAERGFRLRTGEPPSPSKAPAISVRPDGSAAQALERIVGSTVGHALANMQAAARADIEGTHQLRVAIRRMRAALVLFKPHLRRETVERFNAELRRVGRVFGEARDWDVFVSGSLPKAAAHVHVPGWLDLLREAAEVKRTAAHLAAREEQRSAAFTTLMLGLQGWVEDGVHAPALLGDADMAEPIADLASALLDRIAHKVAKRGRGLADASREELHALRKSMKKLCYGVEFLSSMYPRKAVKTYVRACKDVRKLLGKISDAAVTPVLAARLGEGGHADLAPGIGALTDWSNGRRKKASRRLPKAWRAFRAAERFWE